MLDDSLTDGLVLYVSLRDYDSKNVGPPCRTHGSTSPVGGSTERHLWLTLSSYGNVH
jgi:hypothetical protein